MHELGVVFYVIRDVKKIAEENQVTGVHSVTLQIGEVSGILHDYLVDCWNWAKKKEPLLKKTELLIEPIHALTHCDGCGEAYDTIPHGKTCPLCGSDKTWLITGNEFLIKEIAVE